ncbi:MAG: hypothetical protein KAT05_10845 [Spirochaetes bacterium]|nr:hypothetical protein [Spirochaetota bacterium]
MKKLLFSYILAIFFVVISAYLLYSKFIIFHSLLNYEEEKIAIYTKTLVSGLNSYIKIIKKTSSPDFLNNYQTQKDKYQIFNTITEPENLEWQLLLVNKRGYLMYHSHIQVNALTDKERDYSSNPSVNPVLLGKWGLTEVKDNENNRYIYSEFLSEADWILIVQIPKRIIINQVNKIMMPQVLFVIFFLVSLLIITVLMANIFINPLEKLTSSLKKFGQNKGHEIIEMSGKNEIAEAINAFNNMVLDRKQLEKDILEISEQEQKRIGLELHDDLGQILTGISLRIVHLKSQLENKKKITSVNFNEILIFLEEAIKKTRLIAKGLCPVTLYDEGFINSINELINNFNNTFNLNIILESNESIKITDNIVALNLFYVIKEAINNALKHSKTKNIKINIYAKNGFLNIIISDDGVGFNTLQKTGMGLKILSYRSGLINGKLQIKSKKNKGTEIILSIDNNCIII